MIRRFRFCFFVCAPALWLLSGGASADLTQFTISGSSGDRLITLESVVRDTVAYVPLQALVEQAGGAYNILPTRLRVDLDNSTAWLRVGESRVHALSIFSLGKPIAEDNGAALIALDDVPGFFLKSFRVTARPFKGQSPAPAPGPATVTTTPVPPNAQPSPGPPMEKRDEPAALEQLGSVTPPGPATITSVVIDAGHGGYDTGVQSADKLSEAGIALAVAKRVKGLLEADGKWTVLLTRPDEKEVPSPQRVKLVRSQPGSIFISLHLGSSLSPAAEGVAAFYPAAATGPGATGTPGLARTDARLDAESRRLAESLGQAIAQSAGAPLRGIIEAPLKLLSELQVPSAEIELGCLTSSADAQRLASDEYLAHLATGVFNGISAYLGGDTPASAPVAASPAPKVD